MTPNFFQKTISKAMVLLVALTCLQSQSLLLNTAHAADSTISGKTFYDTNKNGINDAGDQILPFLKVSLYDGATLVQGPISIDTTGTYQFTVSTTSTYHVEFSNLPPNYSFSPGNIGSDETIDSDVETVNGLGAGNTGDMFVMGSQTVTDVDAGAYVDTVHVGDYVFQDINTNGIQDSGDSVLTGATASLYNYNSGILGTDTTDIAGHYGINATIPACIGPNGFWNSGNSNMDCTGINVAGGYYDLTFTTSADCQDFGIGISLVAADGSTLFNAMCGAGISDLKNSSSYNFRVGPEVGTGTAHLNFTETGSSHGIGNIMLTYSKLIVTFSGLPMGYGFTSKFTGSDRTVDSDVNNDGNTDILQLFAGDSSDEIDAGVCNPCAPSGTGSISGIVWNDANGNGIYESGSESQYGGASIYVYDANTDSQIGGQGSTGSGPFTFSNMSAGDYYLVFSNIPPSASFSPQNAGADDTLDSDVDASGRTNNFHLNDGESLKNLSAGIYGAGDGGGGGPSGTGIISGIVWNDANGNGIYESASESQYSGVSIEIYDANTDSKIDGQGSTGIAPFTFSNMSAGDYYLVFSNIPPSASFSPQNAGVDDTVDSDVDASGRTNNFHLNDGESLTNLSAGIYGAGDGGGGGGGSGSGDGVLQFHVFTDTNGNGIQDAGEPNGASGTITLSNGSDGMDLAADGDGNIAQSLAESNTYSLTFTLPEGAYVTGRNNPITDISIFSGYQTDLGNIGIYTGIVAGFDLHLFTDNNNNGTQDEGEANGASKVYLVIDGHSESAIPFPTDGTLHANLAPGEYTFSLLSYADGPTSFTGNNANLDTGVVLTLGTTDFGNVGYFSGSGGGGDGDSCETPCGILILHIFTDTNGNGTQESFEPNGASDTSVRVQGGDFNQVVTLDENGDVNGGVYPASYTLTIINPTGTTITGGGNPIHITVIDGDTVNAGSRGIFITTSGGSGGGGGGVVFGGGGSSGGSSGSQSSGWTASSSNNNRSSSNSSNSSSSTKPATVAETPTPQPHTLPVVTPHEEACLLTGGTTPINFYDGTTPDTDFLSGIIFNHNAANRLLHGDGNGHFAGNLPMTRFELLKVALSSNCVAGGNFNTPNSHFSDVNHDQSEQSRVIGEAHARGIITGFNNQFYPNRPVTLGELMKILMGSSAYFPNGIPAADLPVTETGITEPSFVQPIEYAKLLGIIGGDGKPVDQNSVVTRDEMAILIARYIKAMNHLVIAN